MLTAEEARAQLTTASINNLPDSDFAYIEPGGSKDAEGKTTPRSLRHFPIHDATHVRNALARMSQSPFGAKAKDKIMAAAHKFGIDMNSRAEDLTGDIWNGVNVPEGFAAVNSVADLQAAIANLGSDADGVNQHSNQGPIREYIDYLKARASQLKVPGLIPAQWQPIGTVIAPRGTMDQPEERQFSLAEFEIREQPNGNVILAGYASTFNQPYGVRDKYGEFDETILPGAWSRTIANRGSKIHLLVGHGAIPIPLAATRAGTLKLWEDTHGLGYEAELAPRESPLHQDVAYAVRSRAMDEMSVGMRVPEGGDRWNADQSERHISEATLVEISVLPRGANPNTEAMMRGDDIIGEIRRLESMLQQRTGMTYEAAQRQLAARYEKSNAARARYSLLEALK